MVSQATKSVLKPVVKGYRGYESRKARFDDWKSQRPFWGGVLLIASGLVLAYIPLVTLEGFAFTGGTGEVIGLIGMLFAFFVFLSGVAALSIPQISTLAGLTGIVMAILSIVGGTFGGLGLGTLLGMIGGSLCIAWIQEEETVIETEVEEDEDIDEIRKKAQKYEEMLQEGEMDADEIQQELADESAATAEAVESRTDVGEPTDQADQTQPQTSETPDDTAADPSREETSTQNIGGGDAGGSGIPTPDEEQMEADVEDDLPEADAPQPDLTEEEEDS